MEAGQPAQLTGTNRSIALASVHIQRQAASRWNASSTEATGATPVAPKAKAQSQGRQTPFSTRHRARNSLRPACRRRSMGPGPRSRQPLASPRALPDQRRACAPGRSGRPGGHSEGPNTRSHPELGRENPQRRWYCASRRGRVGRRQARQNAPRSPLGPHPQSGRSGPATPTQIPGDPRPGRIRFSAPARRRR